MTTVRAYGSSSPNNTADAGTSSVTGATEFYVTTTAWVTEIWWYQPTSGQTTGTREVGIWQVNSATTGTLMATTISQAPVGTGWQTITLATPVQLVASTRYRVAIRHPAGKNSVTNTYFSGAGAGATTTTTGGLLVVLNAASATGSNQGSYLFSGSFLFPNASYLDANYWADVTVTDVDPAGGGGGGGTTLATYDWTGSNGSAWTGFTTGGTGTIDIQSNAGRDLVGAATAYAIGPYGFYSSLATGVSDYSLTVDVLIGATAQHWFGVGMGLTAGSLSYGDLVSDGYTIEVDPSGSFSLNRCVSGVRTNLSGNVTHTFTAGAWVRVNLTKVGSVVSMTIWNGQGTTQPGTADYSTTDASAYNGLTRPNFALTNGPAAVARTVSFDNMILTDGVTVVVVVPQPIWRNRALTTSSVW